jgi:hypothetical protein
MQAQVEIPRARSAALWLLLLLTVAAGLAMVLIPAWLIQPFRPQTARGIELSYALRVWAPTVTVLAFMVALALSIWLWGLRPGKVRKTLLALLMVPAFAALWFARENHFEWMFAPLPNAKYARIEKADFMNEPDMVMAVHLGGESVAYPIRQLAYHHIVNDVVGGKPITATY